MPRNARIDIPGLLQHVIVRGIEKRDIFVDDTDKQSFMRRFSALLEKTETDCLAWSLMTNHFHLLLRPRKYQLSYFMRRLLTGYAITFNRTHKRVGHLFQNRYKSIVCDADSYLMELVRYIHLNPLRAGLVKNMEGLDYYPWSGHSVLLENNELPEQNIQEVLLDFGQILKKSRVRYREYIVAGISQGRREELVGGGKRRSMKLQGLINDDDIYDERILGSGEFVEHLLREKEIKRYLPSVMSFADLIVQVTKEVGINPKELSQRKKTGVLAEARALICYLAVRRLGCNGREVGRRLSLSRSGVSVAAARGGKIIEEYPRLDKISQEIIDK